MKAIMVMFDTLNRRHLPPYGCDWTHAPNFARLAERTVLFENAYVASMPCMPARRELHTGRYNFLHRSWGPLEPFDDSMPELLKQHGVHTHLITDHQHYWEDGGATYHTRYTTCELIRGQEGDPWKGVVGDFPVPPKTTNHPDAMWRQDWINRSYMPDEADQPQPHVFRLGEEFIRRNAAADNWFLQIETFDPHEPFFTHEKYKELYPHAYDGPHFDWPPYAPVTESPEMVEHMRYEYAALLSMCDHYLGKVLDLMDELDLWDDTMLIVNTDHGFLLGEHEWWAKMVQPMYNEIAHVPLLIWDPRSRIQGERRQCARPDDRHGADAAGVFRRCDPTGHAGQAVARRHRTTTSRCARPGSSASLAATSMWSMGATSTCGRAPSPDERALFRVHAHADAHAQPLRGRGTPGHSVGRAVLLYEGMPTH